MNSDLSSIIGALAQANTDTNYPQSVRRENGRDFNVAPVTTDWTQQSGSVYPLHALPELPQAFVRIGAEARGAPADFVATPLLGFVGAVIGNRLVLEIKSGRQEFPIVWCGVVGGPGTAKSPCQEYAMLPLSAIQKDLRDLHELALADSHELPKDRREERSAPVMASVFSTDPTLDAIGPMLERRNGLAIVHDELAGWVLSFDRFSKAGERQRWLSLWSGTALKSDRKTSQGVYVERPVTCVIGGVQPDRLADLRGSDVNDGFADRMLLSFPVASPQGWRDEEDDERLIEQMRALFRQVNGLQGTEVVRLSNEARSLFRDFENQNAKVISESTGLAAGWSAKAPRHLGRLALICHVLAGNDHRHALSAESLDCAIDLVEHYRENFLRCLPFMRAPGHSTQAAGDAVRIKRYLDRADGGWMSRTELMQATRLSAVRISEAVDRLQREGLAESRQGPSITRPPEEWRSTLFRESGNSGFHASSPSFPESSEYLNELCDKIGAGNHAIPVA